MAIKKGDFVELEYEGRITEVNAVFDTTDEATAKKNGIHNPNVTYGPIVICLGQQHVLKGIENQLEGKDAGKFEFKISPEDGFGKKDAKLFQLVPTSKFKKENIAPMPGLQVNIDGIMGIVRTVSGGRTLVDFNHPLAGKDLDYTITVKRVITDEKEKVNATVSMAGVKSTVDIAEGNATITTKNDVAPPVQEKITEELKKTVPSVKKVEFKKEAEKPKPAAKKTTSQ
ncbi:MAG: peptidylprolyl isomerase [bacterium]|nr:peptidylprolyl isomerase [bacterium]